MRGRTVWIVIWVAFAGLAAFAGFFVSGLLSGGDDRDRDRVTQVAAERDGARETAAAFLAAWAAGRYEDAGELTDAPATAAAALRSFTDGLDITRTRLTPGTWTTTPGASTALPFTATVAVSGLGTWTFTSTVPVSAPAAGSRPLVRWSLAVIHPKLNRTVRFRLERDTAPAPVFADRRGRRLDPAAHPSLAPVLTALAERVKTGPADPRAGRIELVTRDTGEVRETVAALGRVAAGRPARTTLDVTVQAAAERAVAGARRNAGKNTALVALDTRTGGVLAVVNAPQAGFNRAFSGTYAPGSTMKIITSAALLAERAVRPAERVGCPPTATAGRTFRNVEGEALRDATFRQAFAMSCNTTFVGLRDRLPGPELNRVATRVFGIGTDWDVGVPTFDGKVPVPTGDAEKAAAGFGQGQVQMNPLTMASVVATAVTGRFRQPVLLPEQGQVRAPERLGGTVSGQLRDLMRATVTAGTARPVLGALPGFVGAKTGTAEVGGGAPNNGWLVAFRHSVAVACLVEGGGRGVDSAGPVVRDFLRATG